MVCGTALEQPVVGPEKRREGESKVNWWEGMLLLLSSPSMAACFSVASFRFIDDDDDVAFLSHLVAIVKKDDSWQNTRERTDGRPLPNPQAVSSTTYYSSHTLRTQFGPKTADRVVGGR